VGDRNSNETIMRKAFGAVQGRDPAALEEVFHPDVEWHDLAMDNPLGSEHKGLGAVLTFLAAKFESSADTLQVELHDVLANDEHGVALARLTAKRQGRSLEDRAAFVVHFEGDMIREVFAYADDPEKVNRFWS
jgi:ketosteroid isomerase-like protein